MIDETARPGERVGRGLRFGFTGPAIAVVWPFEVAVFLWPTGVVQTFTGTVDDGYNGLLGWFWVASSVMM